ANVKSLLGGLAGKLKGIIPQGPQRPQLFALLVQSVVAPLDAAYDLACAFEVRFRDEDAHAAEQRHVGVVSVGDDGRHAVSLETALQYVRFVRGEQPRDYHKVT